jgi:hypothetical protein
MPPPSPPPPPHLTAPPPADPITPPVRATRTPAWSAIYTVALACRRSGCQPGLRHRRWATHTSRRVTQAAFDAWSAGTRIRRFGMRFPTRTQAVLAARKSAFALAADFFLVPLAMPCETAFSTAPSVTPFFTAFRTAFSIFLTALVCFLATVQSLRSEDYLQLGIVHVLRPSTRHSTKSVPHLSR